MEQYGYKRMKKYYKVSKLIAIDDTSRMVMYEYNDLHRKNKGLLVDFFATKDSLNKEYYDLFTDYIHTFDKTIKYTKKGNCGIFFEKRLKTRLKNNIDYLKQLNIDNQVIILNNKKVEIKPLKITNNIHKYFKNLKNEWCVISNCDPNDLNICMDKMLFDYTGGGNVPLIAEFAVFTCYNLIQGEYLSLKYNKTAFKNHKKIYKKLNKCKINSNTIIHRPRNIRIDAIEFYAKKIVEPLLTRINYLNWYDDFKYYFVMKLLAVFQFNKMSRKDILLSLSYSQLFFEADINSVDDLISFIKTIYE